MMDKAKRKALEAAGFRIGDAEDFLELTEEERSLVELRIAVSRAVRRKREEQHLTQQQLASKLKSSQSRIAKIEAGAVDVSLDLLFRSLFAMGGKLTDLTVAAEPPPRDKQADARPRPARGKRPTTRRPNGSSR